MIVLLVLAWPAESRERVRGALNASGLALPPKRMTVNLAPADLPKEGSHYDLPIALGLMAATSAQFFVVPRKGGGFIIFSVATLETSLNEGAQSLPHDHLEGFQKAA